MVKWIFRLLFLAALGYGAFWGWRWWTAQKQVAEVVRFRYAPVLRSDVVRTVEATGTVKPIKEVEVGAQVNGKIVQLFVDYNSVVTNGQVVALIDPQVYEANYKSALGQLHGNVANVEKCKAALVLAEKTLVRKQALKEKGMCPIADYDSALAERDGAAAALAAAKASVEQSQASVSQARANLDYCTIVSPVDGVVIERSVDEGQTVVSSMNAVALLTIAEDLKVIWVEATVPEADVGAIRVGQKVTFTADAYRRTFMGRVKQIRLAATTTNNVVTYPIIIEAENPGEMLFPGMTVNISVETARAEDVLCVTSAAFRFRPKDEHVAGKEGAADDAPAKPAAGVPGGRKPKQVWLEAGPGKVECVTVEDGISDDAFTELKAPASLEGKKVVVGYETSASGPAGGGEEGQKNPFMPKPPQRHKNRGTAPAPRK